MKNLYITKKNIKIQVLLNCANFYIIYFVKIVIVIIFRILVLFFRQIDIFCIIKFKEDIIYKK